MAQVPEKPSLEGLEAKWDARWEADGTFRFDRARDRHEIYSIDTPPPTVTPAFTIAVAGQVRARTLTASAVLTNSSGNFLLDTFMRASSDGGLTWGPEIQLNDVSFDPDLGAGTRFPGPPPTKRTVTVWFPF